FSTLTAFLAWFGGTGYLLERYTALWLLFAFAIATAMGLSGAAIVIWFLAKLTARDRTLDPADFDMIGVLGHVSSTVHKGCIGEMIFTQDGGGERGPPLCEGGRARADRRGRER